MKHSNLKLIIFILSALAAIAPFSIDMYLPAFPTMAENLGTDIAHITLSLTSFFIGISVGQLLYGPLLDRVGRKKPLLFGLILYTLASIGCAFASSERALIALRLLQALGGCGGMVAVRAIVRDIFPIKDIAKIISTIMLVMGIAPIIAPTAGSVVMTAFGWRAIFYALAAFGAVLIAAVVFALPESKQPDPSISLRPTKILGEYFSVLKQPQFLAYALCGGLGSAGMFAYISGSPFVYIKLFGISEAHYGWLFGLNAFGLIFGSQLNRFVLRRFTSQQAITVISSLQASIGVLLIVSSTLGQFQMIATLVLISGYLFLQGFLYPNTTALALIPFEKNAGAASAMMGFLQMVCSSLASAMVSYLHNGTALPMTGVMAVCAGLGLLSLLTILRKREVGFVAD
ncbi:MAG TPA: multidrug effflux MFS transporter [Blastocatellia bacterium]|nr:multidrug effflux MFS transporter [Blastocatellia bacterium]